MHTSVIQSPQAMTNDQSYRPRSPDLPGLVDTAQYQSQQQGLPRLGRLPSYQIEEPSLPRGYSFSPRGSYDASPFFSQPSSQQAPNQPFGTQPGISYPDQSPPRFTPASISEQPQAFSPVSYIQSPQRQQFVNPVQKSTSQFHPLQTYSEQQFQPSIDEMARLRSRKPVNYNEDHNGPQYEEPLPVFSQSQPLQQMQQMPQQPQQMPAHVMPPQFMQQPMHLGAIPQAPIQPTQTQTAQPAGPPMPAVDVRTKFPVARIKRIMQADEDVGKVAQATPTAVSKALELFMIALVTKGALEAKNNNSKRVTATHLKHALLKDSQFDFLNEICESVPDEGGKGSKGRAKSEAKSEESEEEVAGTSKRKGKGGRKKKGGEDENSD